MFNSAMGAGAEGSGPSTACSMLGDNDGNDEDDDCRGNSGASGGGRWSGDGSAITSTGAGDIDPGGSREGEGGATSGRGGTAVRMTPRSGRGARAR